MKQLDSSSATWVNQWEVESDSHPGKMYTVSQKADGSWACACIGWTRHVPRKDCRHIIRVRSRERAATPTEVRNFSRYAEIEKLERANIWPQPAAVKPAEPVFLLQTKRSIRLVD